MRSSQKARFRSSHPGETNGKSMGERTLATIFLSALLAPLVATAQTSIQRRTTTPSAAVPPEVVQLATQANQALSTRDYSTAIQDLEKATWMAPEVAEFQANLGMA